MSLREIMNRNPRMSAVVATILLVLAAGALMLRGGRSDSQQHKYSYYMMPQSGRMIVDVSGQASPLANGAVRAVVFSCSSCSDGDSHFVGWLEMYTDQAKAAMQQLQQEPKAEDPTKSSPSPQATMAVEQGRLIAAAPENAQAPHWVAANSSEARAVLKTVRSRCGKPQICSPSPSEIQELVVDSQTSN